MFFKRKSVGLFFGDWQAQQNLTHSQNNLLFHFLKFLFLFSQFFPNFYDHSISWIYTDLLLYGRTWGCMGLAVSSLMHEKGAEVNRSVFWFIFIKIEATGKEWAGPKASEEFTIDAHPLTPISKIFFPHQQVKCIFYLFQQWYSDNLASEKTPSKVGKNLVIKNHSNYRFQWRRASRKG